MKNWKAADIVKLTNDKNFLVITQGVMADTKEDCVIFRDINGDSPVQVLKKEEFDKIFILKERI